MPIERLSDTSPSESPRDTVLEQQAWAIVEEVKQGNAGMNPYGAFVGLLEAYGNKKITYNKQDYKLPKDLDRLLHNWARDDLKNGKSSSAIVKDVNQRLEDLTRTTADDFRQQGVGKHHKKARLF